MKAQRVVRICVVISLSLGIAYGCLKIYRRVVNGPSLETASKRFPRYRADFELLRNAFIEHPNLVALPEPQGGAVLEPSLSQRLQDTMSRIGLVEAERREQVLRFSYHNDVNPMSMWGGTDVGIMFSKQVTKEQPPAVYSYFHGWGTVDLGDGWWAYRGTK